MSTAHPLAAAVWFLAAAALAATGCATVPASGEEQDAPIAIVAFSPDGRLLATARRGASAIVLLDAHTLSLQRELRGTAATPVRSLDFSDDGTRIVAAGIDDTVVAWDLATGRELFRRAELKGARHAALSPNGELVAVAGPGREASVWRIANQHVAARLKGHFDEVLAVAFAHRADQIATGSADRTVRLWTLEGPVSVTLPEWHRAAVTGLAFSRDDSLLAALGGDLTLWRVAERRSIAHALEPAPVAAMSEATERALRMLLMILASAGPVAHGGAPVYIGPGGGLSASESAAGLLQVAFSPDGRLFAVLRRAVLPWGRNEVVIAEVAGTRVTRLTCECAAIAFRPDGRALVAAGREIQFWDPDTGAPLAR